MAEPQEGRMKKQLQTCGKTCQSKANTRKDKAKRNHFHKDKQEWSQHDNTLYMEMYARRKPMRHCGPRAKN